MERFLTAVLFLVALCASRALTKPLQDLEQITEMKGHPNEMENRKMSSANLSKIWRGLWFYSEEHQGKYPADFGELFKAGKTAPEVFTNPRLGEYPISSELKADRDKLADMIKSLNHYIYLAGNQPSTLYAGYVVAYENPELVEEGVNLMYSDGHVEFLQMAEAIKVIEYSKAYYAEHPGK